MATELLIKENFAFRNTTWFENLLIGLQTIFIHPFVPLLKTSFDLDCLLARKPYCCSHSSACQSSSSFKVSMEPAAGDIMKLFTCCVLLSCFVVKDLGDIILVWIDKRVLNNSPRLGVIDLTATKN